MQVVDINVQNMVPFSDVKIGEGFEYDNYLFIKVTMEDAFDVLNNCAILFADTIKVLPRETSITFM